MESTEIPGTRASAPPANSVEAPLNAQTPATVTAYAAYLAVTGKNLRKALAKKIFEGEKPSRLPNAVEIEVDLAALLNERFLADGLLELRERPGILVSGDDPHSFEAMPVETLRTEAGDLFDRLKAEIDRIDPSRQVLALSSKPIFLLGDDGKTRESYHLVRLTKVRSHVERKGLALELPNRPNATEAAA